jgi:tripartite-type tricarboxylate transporter receptor subunit TctC
MSVMKSMRVLSAMVVLASPLSAFAYPDRPIRVIVPYAAGGSSDSIARLIGQRLSETLGQQMIVENRPGAGATIGTEMVAKAPADGYTLVLADSPHTINPSFYPKLGFHPVNDFAPITLVGAAPFFIFSATQGPIGSLRELIAQAKAQPSTLTYGSSGNGSSSHMVAELFQMASGTKLIHVPYKGAAPAITDAAAGQVATVFATLASGSPQVRAGRLRMVAVTGAARNAAAPDVPTLEESGITGMRQEQWWGYLAPARTPPEVIARLQKEIAAAITAPSIRERFAGLGVDPKASSSAEFRDLIGSELTRWAQVVKNAGIKSD